MIFTGGSVSGAVVIATVAESVSAPWLFESLVRCSMDQMHSRTQQQNATLIKAIDKVDFRSEEILFRNIVWKLVVET